MVELKNGAQHNICRGNSNRVEISVFRLSVLQVEEKHYRVENIKLYQDHIFLLNS